MVPEIVETRFKFLHGETKSQLLNWVDQIFIIIFLPAVKLACDANVAQDEAAMRVLNLFNNHFTTSESKAPLCSGPSGIIGKMKVHWCPTAKPWIFDWRRMQQVMWSPKQMPTWCPFLTSQINRIQNTRRRGGIRKIDAIGFLDECLEKSMFIDGLPGSMHHNMWSHCRSDELLTEHNMKLQEGSLSNQECRKPSTDSLQNTDKTENRRWNGRWRTGRANGIETSISLLFAWSRPKASQM